MIISFFHSHYLILLGFLFIMAILAGFVDSVAGGGGLISIPALTITGMPVVTVLGTSKLQAMIGTSVAVYKYYSSGLIDFMTVWRGLIMGFVGAVCGAVAVYYISNQFMQVVVPFLLLGVFVFSLLNKTSGLHVGVKRVSEVVFFSVFGFIFGFYDGFFGPGVGNFWVIAIVFFLGYTFLNASGYAKVLNLKSNLFSLAVFIYYGQVNYMFALVMAVGQCIGNYCGAHVVILKGSKFVRPFFMFVVGINVIVSFYTLLFSHTQITG